MHNGLMDKLVDISSTFKSVLKNRKVHVVAFFLVKFESFVSDPFLDFT